MQVAVQMNPLAGLDFASDSTVGLIITAQQRGHDVWVFTPDDTSFANGTAMARAQKLTSPIIRGQKRYDLATPEPITLSAMDVVLVRQEPPYDVGYHVNTFFLEAAARANPDMVFINHPRALRNVHEKLSALALIDLMPATMISPHVDEILAFAADQQDTVIKPLSLFSGQGIFRQSESQDFAGDIAQLLATSGEPVVAQAFIPGVTAADKRVMVVNGTVHAAVGRRPKSGGFIANIHAGGQPFATELTERETQTAQTVAQFLREENIFFAGVDLIDGYLSEINVTCPTLIWELIDLGGPNMFDVIWDAVQNRKATARMSP